MADAFQPKFVDLVRNLTTTTGTADFVLGPAVDGFTSLLAAFDVGDRFYYSAIGIDRPSEREVGRGTLLAGGVVRREPTAGAKTNFSNGAKAIAVVAAAEWFSRMEAGGSAASRAELTACSPARRAVLLSERGREGQFVWDGADLSALVAVDARQGMFVAPSSDPSGASGAWTRSRSQGVNVRWFGATGDGASDDGPAFTAAVALLKALAVNDDSGMYKGSSRLFVPAGLYNLRTTTLDITHTLIIEGESSLLGNSSMLIWTGDCDGIRVQAYNTVGNAGVEGPHYSGAYTTIRNLGLAGPYRNATDFTGRSEGEFHAINVRSNVVIEDVMIDGFAGDGVHAFTSIGGGGAQEGGSNCSFINRLRVTNVRNGVYLNGGDCNAWTIVGVVGTYCRQYTVWDSSFLGNTHIGHHSARAGMVKGVAPSVVSHVGKLYAVRAGQASGAQTNAPSGTGSDNSWWLYLGPGAPDPGVNTPGWQSGMTIREGGCFRTDSPGFNQMIGLYNEGGEGPAQFSSPTVVIGGTWGTRDPVGDVNYYAGQKLVAMNDVSLGQTRIGGAVGGRQLGLHNSSATAAGISSSLTFEQGFEADGTTPRSVARIGAWASTNNPATAEGVLTFGTRTYTGSGGYTDWLQLNGPALFWGPINPNQMDSGASGLRWKKGWFNALDATGSITSSGGGVGYAAGAGGAVVQAGSKTAAVTLNRVCGVITTAASALAAGAAASFTVNDSEVAATDTIILNLAGGSAGAGAYHCRVDGVATGSFRVTVENRTSGALSEALTVNFAVLKAVSA